MSTPAYRTIVDLHGWGAAAEQLSQMARRGEWSAMGSVITDPMLEAFAVSGKWADLPGLIQSRYAAASSIASPSTSPTPPATTTGAGAPSPQA